MKKKIYENSRRRPEEGETSSRCGYFKLHMGSLHVCGVIPSMSAAIIYQLEETRMNDGFINSTPVDLRSNYISRIKSDVKPFFIFGQKIPP